MIVARVFAPSRATDIARSMVGMRRTSVVTSVQVNVIFRRNRGVVITLSVAFWFMGGACATNRSVHDARTSEAVSSSKRMADGKEWTTENLNVGTTDSYCYGDTELNCRQYGRLYTWESAQRGCQSLGDGWRLPTNDDWRQMAKHYGGIRDESADTGKSAYKALLMGGSSGFNARLGGGRSPDGAANMLGRRPMASTGPHRKRVRQQYGSTTLVRASCLSVVILMVRSSGRFL